MARELPEPGPAMGPGPPTPTVDDGTLHLYFPVEIEVLPAADASDVDAAADRALGRLVQGLQSTG
jgi:hypothetical protein